MEITSSAPRASGFGVPHLLQPLKEGCEGGIKPAPSGSMGLCGKIGALQQLPWSLVPFSPYQPCAGHLQGAGETVESASGHGPSSGGLPLQCARPPRERYNELPEGTALEITDSLSAREACKRPLCHKINSTAPKKQI